MLLSATFSKPTPRVNDVFDKPYIKIKIKTNSSSTGNSYFAEFFTQTQVFHKTMSQSELDTFITEHAGTSFKSCTQRFDDKEITILSNKKGKITRLEKAIKPDNKNSPLINSTQNTTYANPALPTLLKNQNHNRQKNYIIKEGTPVPFLIKLGVMTPDGKIVNSKYDKFKQINRFLEYIDDILPAVMDLKENETNPLQIADFGCGKSYLTFAVHYFLNQIKKINCRIIGLDLKKEVIEYCNSLAKDFKCEGLIFKTGDISQYSDAEPEHNPDIVITLHACDTATDFALQYAVSKNAKAILSVPCCQHEINSQLGKNKSDLLKTDASVLSPLLKHGLIRERFAALITDSLRAEYLEQNGYKTDVMEFIDMSHTPKNILLRAVKKCDASTQCNTEGIQNASPELVDFLKIEPTIFTE